MTYYYDMTETKACMGILPEPGATVILTGYQLHTEPTRCRGEASERFIRDYDFHFWFDDEKPEVCLYAVPMITLGGYDSRGGLFAGSPDFQLGRDEPLYYIDCDRNCFLIAKDSREFLAMGLSWRERMTPTDAIELFHSREEAMQKYPIRVVRA